MLLCEVPTFSTMPWTLISWSPSVHSIYNRSGCDMALSDRDARSMSSSRVSSGGVSPGKMVSSLMQLYHNVLILVIHYEVSSPLCLPVYRYKSVDKVSSVAILIQVIIFR